MRTLTRVVLAKGRSGGGVVLGLNSSVFALILLATVTSFRDCCARGKTLVADETKVADGTADGAGDGGRGDPLRYFGPPPYEKIERLPWPESLGGCCRRPGRLLLRDLQREQRPVILTGTPASKWKALERWRDNPSYLLSILPPTMHGVYVTQRGNTAITYESHRALASRQVPGALAQPRYKQSVVDTRSLLDAIAHPNQSSLPAVMYYNDNLRTPDAAPLLGDLDPMAFMQPPVAPHVSKGSRVGSLFPVTHNAWFAGQNVTATAHFDTSDNLFAQIVGRKRFLIAPPSESHRLYPLPSYHPSERQSSGSFDAQFENLSRPLMPLLGTARPIEAVLDPGDVLYMPAMCE